MKPLRRLSLAEQIATHIAEAMQSGRWGGVLPGVRRLAAELDASPETVRAALRLLEDSGQLAASGPGRSRIIAAGQASAVSPRVLRVAVLLHEPLVGENAEMQRLLFQMQAAIVAAGHECFFATKNQQALAFSVPRITRHVQATAADAWIVLAGSLELLTWFAAQPFPSMAVGGQNIGVPIATVNSGFRPALEAAVRALVGLGHRRIVMIGPKQWRLTKTGGSAHAFKTELAAHGIAPSDYHLPEWEETREGFQTLLGELFRITPPTALLVLEPAHAIAVLGFVGQRGIQIGRDLSLICMINDPAFAWRHPTLAHFDWDTGPVIRRIVRWVGAVAHGRVDRRRMDFPATFIPGGTVMAPPPSDHSD